MPENITTLINEGSDAGIQFTLEDSDGNAVLDSAVTSVHWTWTDTDGNAINSRTDVAITTANATVIVPLDQADTVITAAEVAALAAAGENTSIIYRLLTMVWVYNDTNLGIDARAVREYKIGINNFTNEEA